jgi:hypothetical protein
MSFASHFFSKIKDFLYSDDNILKQQKVLLFETYVVGIRHNVGYEYIRKLSLGQTVVLIREPENSFDSNAIEVFTQDGVKLGYIPKKSNLLPKVIADEGVELIGEIVDITSKINPSKFIKIAVYQLI